MEPFLIENDVFPFYVVVHIGEDKMELCRYVVDKFYKITDPVEVTTAMGDLMDSIRTSENRVIRSDNSKIALLTVDNIPNTPARIGILNHEIFHVVHDIMEIFLLCKLDDNTAEPYAYMEQYYTQEIYQKLQDLNIDISCDKYLSSEDDKTNKLKQIEINGLLWDTENLEIDGKKYFTWQEAMDAAKSIGKRLPTSREFDDLIFAGYKFDKDKKGMWFADNKLFFPSSMIIEYASENFNDADEGYSWSSSPNKNICSWYLYFCKNTAIVSVRKSTDRLPVRCVQDISYNKS